MSDGFFGKLSVFRFLVPACHFDDFKPGFLAGLKSLGQYRMSPVCVSEAEW
jgi:hypothetical protein